MPEVRVPGFSSLVGQAISDKITSGTILLTSPPAGGRLSFVGR